MQVGALPEITVVVADPDPTRRDLIVTRLNEEAGVTVLDATGDPARATERILDLLPDAVLFDIELPDQTALGLCWSVLQQAPALQLIVMAGPEDSNTAYQAITYGAAGCLQRAEVVQACGPAVRGATRGEYLLPPLMAARVMHDVDAYSRAVDHAFGAGSPLTATEREVLSSLASGETPEAIARRHSVTPRLVNLHTGYAVAKLQRHAERARAALTQRTA